LNDEPDIRLFWASLWLIAISIRVEYRVLVSILDRGTRAVKSSIRAALFQTNVCTS